MGAQLLNWQTVVEMKKILVLCRGNSCRSIMAEALINTLCSDHYQALSAGSTPTGEVHPQALATLARYQIPVDKPRSKSWDEFSGSSFDLLITVCDAAAEESCPILVGEHQRLHWNIPDPDGVEGSAEQLRQAFESTFETLRAHIENELLSNNS